MRDLRSRQPLSELGPHPCCGPLGALKIMRMRIHGGDGMGWNKGREGAATVEANTHMCMNVSTQTEWRRFNKKKRSLT